MENFRINFIKATAQLPVSIEVSAQFDRNIVKQIKKVTNISDEVLSTNKSYFKADDLEMIRYSLPGVSNDQLSQITWFIGDWYSRMKPLLSTNLN